MQTVSLVALCHMESLKMVLMTAAATDVITATGEEGQSSSTTLISGVLCLYLLSWYLLSAKCTVGDL